MSHPQVFEMVGACPFCHTKLTGSDHRCAPDPCVFCRLRAMEARVAELAGALEQLLPYCPGCHGTGHEPYTATKSAEWNREHEKPCELERCTVARRALSSPSLQAVLERQRALEAVVTAARKGLMMPDMVAALDALDALNQAREAR